MTGSREAVAELQGVTKSYKGGTFRRRETSVLRGLDLRIESGSVHGLLGPNGAGKTTALKLLLGFISADTGEVNLFGSDPRRPESRERLGFLPEQPYFNRAFTGRETLRYLARLRLPDLPEAVLTETLREVGLLPSADRRVSTYSRGMLQRLGLAQALAGGPDILVLDEPSLGLDPLGQEEFKRIIRRQREAGRSILLSSHQLSAVEETCDSVTFLIDGAAAASGSLDEQLAGRDRYRLILTDGPEGAPAIPGALSDRTLDDGSREYVLAADRRDDALGSAVAAGASVTLLEPMRRSLEDRFLELAGGAE